ncbi:uncharacterized protein LOC8258837 [Ricinus communis]|uniref:Uncharacterized protein n=1 Tax=Ricinus communis TaxID=3988 RepID=B9RZS8_RICCO|nr:uncharacterized protein LOC8258837 [Ricinus communis]XP_048234875.1 uncharacterized protein LOC8258837 [Ricinus communis]EEF43111.1 conserved hypothetical protein [Ricinus communis]|eukprot:XP_002519247.1 uncharacterized protein LOC8258837 [Ricinus communis]
MKDNNQTPKKEDIANRRTKESRLTKSQKIVKRSLNAAYPPVSEDVSTDTTKDLTDFSSISEISDANCSTQIAQSSELDSASSEAFSLCDITPTSKIATNYDHHANASSEHCKFHKLDHSVEVDIVSDFLKQAGNRVLNSNDVDRQSKKLLDGLLKVVLDECYSLPEERDCYDELVSAKLRIVFLCFFIWSFASLIFFSLRSGSSYSGLPPT